MTSTMRGVVLPGNSTAELKEFDIPEPGPRQVLVKMKASTICGSDIRAIYREHLGTGPEAYQGVIVGHEPCGRIEKAGPGCRRFREGDRVIIYHISGCGVCRDCRAGYRISCSSSLRAAYGWQRDGGMAEYCLAEEDDLVLLPDELSYIDGACVACGFGTCYEALRRIGVSGDDRTLVVGLGPMGLAALMIARGRGSTELIGVDVSEARVELAKSLGIADHLLTADDNALDRIEELTEGIGCEVAVDCSGNPKGRQLAVRGTGQWGRVAFVGEGGSVELSPSPDLIHEQKSIHGSWVTSIGHMEELVERMVRWKLHPEITVTHRLPLERAADAYATMAGGECGKVAVVMDES